MEFSRRIFLVVFKPLSTREFLRRVAPGAFYIRCSLLLSLWAIPGNYRT
jgi:hypothetical protein